MLGSKMRCRSGFTLIELMVVVVIIGVLAAIAIPRFSNVATQAKQAEAGPILKQLCTFGEAEFLNRNAWTATEAELAPWAPPPHSLYSFQLAGSTATATPTDPTLPVVQMDCVSKDFL